MVQDRIDALERLARLRDTGALSEAEFQAEKRRALGSEPLGPLPVSPVDAPLDESVDEPISRRRTLIAAIGAAVVLLIGVAWLVKSFATVPVPVATPVAHRPRARAADPVAALAATPAAVDVSTTLRLDLSDGCSFGATGDALFDRLIAYDGSAAATTPPTVTLGGVVLPTMSSISAADDGSRRYSATATASAPLVWHGLRLAGVFATSAYNGESRERALLFTDTPADVRATLAMQGVAVPLPPAVRELDSEVNESVSLGRRDGRTTLTCALDV